MPSAISSTAPMSAMLGPSGINSGWHSATSATAAEYFRPTASKRRATDSFAAAGNDDNRPAHAVISPSTSASVRSSAFWMTADASLNCASVQIRGGAQTIVSNTARMINPSRKK